MSPRLLDGGMVFVPKFDIAEEKKLVDYEGHAIEELQRMLPTPTGLPLRRLAAVKRKAQ